MVATTSDLKNAKHPNELNFGRGLRAKTKKDGSASWFFRQKMKGERSPVFMGLGTWPETNHDQAEDKARIYRAKIADGIHPKDYEEEQATIKKQKEMDANAEAITLRALLEKYNRMTLNKNPPNSDKTIYDRTHCITKVYEDWLDLPVQIITATKIEDRLYEWGSQRGAKSQGAKAVRYLRSILWYAKRRLKVIKENPCEDFINETSVSSKPNKAWLTVPECWTFYEAIVDAEKEILSSRKISLREQYYVDNLLMTLDAIMLGFLTGLRQQEVLGLTKDKVYLDEKDWREEGGDGAFFSAWKSKTRTWFGVPITRDMKPILERRVNKSANKFLFPSPRRNEKGEWSHMTTDRHGYKYLNEQMPILKKAKTLNQLLIRKTFTTTAFNEFRRMDIVDSMTGHITGLTRGNLATGNYIAFQSTDNREYFERVNDVMVGRVDIPDWVDEVTGDIDFEVVEGGYVTDQNK